MPVSKSALNRFPYRRYELRIAGALLASYVAVSALTRFYIPASTHLYPASVIALVALFFGGLRLFPFVFCAVILVSGLVGEVTLPSLFAGAAVTFQAVVGAGALRSLKVDPLFRRARDTLRLALSATGASFAFPAMQIAQALSTKSALSPSSLAYGYAAALASILVIAPFLMRWLAKPGFARSGREALETAAAFAVLVAACLAAFGRLVGAWGLIPVLVAVFVPLLYVALRLRPRFVTLALVITSAIGISSVIIPEPQASAAVLLNLELYLIAVSVILLLISSLNEEVRVTGNLLRSQLAMQENASARFSSESNAKNDFLAILAHELRNPLAPIVSAVELLQLKGARDRDDQEALDTIMDRMRIVRRLLDDLLDISRINEGKLSLKIEAADLVDILKRSIISTAHHRKELHQTLDVSLPLERLPVSGDPVRLEQVFSNLLTNASKYSNSGSHIKIKACKHEGEAQVEVADEGIGIAAEALEKIFEPFQQLGENERTAKGLGIGLSLVKSFVELHGGTVYAESAGAGAGSLFVTRLPMMSAIGDLGRKGRLNCLIVDSNDTDAAVLGQLAELHDLDVSYAYRREQAIESIRRNAYDLALIDADLPRREGFEIARTLASRNFKGMLVGVSKADANALSPQDRATFAKWLKKPVRREDLQAIARDYGQNH